MQKRTGKPIAAGVLGIIAGVIALIIGIVLVSVVATVSDYYCDYYYCDYRNYIAWGWMGPGIAFLVLGFLAILGSSLALARRSFGMAVVGGIAAFLGFWPLGLPALILVSLSSNEFGSLPSSPLCASCGRQNPPGSTYCMGCGRELVSS